MPHSYRLMALLAVGVALALVIGLGGRPAQALTVNENLFINEVNNFVGTGGEILINDVLSGDDPATPGFDPDGVVVDPDGAGPIPPHLIQRIDVGDRLVGIGSSQLVECLSCLPGPGITTHTLGSGGNNLKAAMRAMQVTGKVAVPGGFDFTFGALSPAEFSATIDSASGGAVVIPVASIPVGTMVLGFDDPTPGFTLLTVPGSPGTNWVEATDGDLWGFIGIGSAENFWVASFPSDDLGLLPLLPPSVTTGTIDFGLSLLQEGIIPLPSLEPVSCTGPTGIVPSDFCLTGVAVGTSGIDTPFPIGLAVDVSFHPVSAVGGTVELLRQSESPGDASESSARDYTAPIAAAVAAGVLVLTAGGWYARRRWLR